MRILILLGALTVVAGCLSPAASLRVASLPEGMRVEVQGYRFLLRGIHELDVSVRNVGEGVLYRLNDHEIMVVTGREIQVDGDVLDLDPGDLHVIDAWGPPGEGESRRARRKSAAELMQPTP